MLNLEDNSARHASLAVDAALGESPERLADLALIRRVAELESDAQEQLADRLVARVRRAAHALMGGSLDAEDAAQHALTELLRSHRRFRSSDSVESWADRVMSGSIVRYARAVQRRSGSADSDLADTPKVRTRNQTALQEALAALAPGVRETLLLRHLFGHSTDGIAALTQVSAETVRDRLILARRELRRRVFPFSPAINDPGLVARVERWEALSDREAAGDLLGSEEIDELRALGQEHEQVVLPWIKLIQDLAGLLQEPSGKHSRRLDDQVVSRALSSVQVTAPGRRVRAIDHDRELARAADPEGPSWLPILATAMSALMMVGTGLSLLYYEPRSVGRAASESPLLEDTGATFLVPQVEPLLHARAAERGPRLRREGKPVAQAGLISQGDEISAGDKAGCFVVDGRLELCLAANSTIKLENLSTFGLKLSLWRGRVTSHLVRGATPVAYRVTAGDLHVVGEEAATLGIERNDDASVVRVRLLRGAVAVEVGADRIELTEPTVASYRSQEGTLDTTDLLGGVAQREWEVVAAGRFGAAIVPNLVTSDSAREAVSAEVKSPEEGVAEDTEEEPASHEANAMRPKPPRELMQDAWELLKAERWADAAKIYEYIGREMPESEEAHIVKVRLGGLLLERLGDPARALFAFEGYLRQGGGPLSAEARYGRIAVFRRVGQPEYERRAIEEFLRAHADSPHVAMLEARLRVLGP